MSKVLFIKDLMEKESIEWALKMQDNVQKVHEVLDQLDFGPHSFQRTDFLLNKGFDGFTEIFREKCMTEFLKVFPSELYRPEFKMPDITEYRNSFDPPSWLHRSFPVRMAESPWKPKALLSDLDFPEGKLGSRGLAEIRKRCSVLDAPGKSEWYEAALGLENEIKKAKKFLDDKKVKLQLFFPVKNWRGELMRGLLVLDKDNNYTINPDLFD